MENLYTELGASLSSSKRIRNIIKPYSKEVIDEFRTQHINTDVFTSVYLYDNENVRQGTLSGPLYFDLDGEYAKDDLIALLEFLKKYNCPDESVHIFYSGNKGFHVEIPFEALGIKPDPYLHKAYELIAKEIKTILHTPSIDTGIYDSVRLWRLPNSINSKSGLYKIPLYIEEVHLPLEAIKEMAKKPRDDFEYARPIVWSEFANVYTKAKKRTTNTRFTKGVFEPVGEGQRNDTTFRRAIRLKAEGKTLDEAVEICKRIQDNPPLPDSEIIRTVASAYQDKYVVKQMYNTEKNDGVHTTTTSFVVTKEGLLCEEVFDPRIGEPLYAIYDGESIDYRPSIESNGKIFSPINNILITSGIVKLPREASKYESETELFDKIKQFIHTYVDIDETWEQWAAYYVLLSWVYDKLPVCPYICALGASSTGKTRFIQTVGSICYKPFIASGSATASPIFRILDTFRGTLIVNEFDHIGQFNDEIVVIFNNGFEADLPVIRTEGEDRKEVKVFQVYGPKLFSARKRKSDWAFESRLLTLPMKETKRRDIPPFLLEDFHQQASELRNMLLMFRFKHYSQKAPLRTDLFPNIRGRLRQTLLSITSVIQDEAFLEKAEEFAMQLEKSLKTIKDFDIDSFVYQVLAQSWKEGEHTPQIKDVAAKVKQLAAIEKLSSKAVGNIVRDELGFETRRGGSSGNYVIHLSSEQLERLKDRYEITEQEAETTSGTSVSSGASTIQTEATEQTELGTE